METAVIPAIYLVMSVLVLWFIIGIKGKFLTKVVVITIVVLFSTCLWKQMDNIAGWPTTQPLPAKFRLYSAVIDEPKAIFVWVKNVVDENRPRAHQLKYDKQTHDELSQILSQIADGKPFFGTMNKDLLEGLLGESDGDGNFGNSGYNSQSGQQVFYQLPPPKMGAK